MQLLTFTIGGQAYAIESKKVVEVLPLVTTRPIPHLPDYLPGIFTYRGHFVPLVDLGLRINSTPLTRRLSTRVIVVEIGESDSSQPSQPSRLVRFGVMAENVVTIRSTGTTAGETEAKNLAADSTSESATGCTPRGRSDLNRDFDFLGMVASCRFDLCVPVGNGTIASDS